MPLTSPFSCAAPPSTSALPPLPPGADPAEVAKLKTRVTELEVELQDAKTELDGLQGEMEGLLKARGLGAWFRFAAEQSGVTWPLFRAIFFSIQSSPEG